MYAENPRFVWNRISPIKIEGMTMSYDEPEIGNWDGLESDFESFYIERHSRAVRFIFGRLLKPTLKGAWDAALHARARSSYERVRLEF